MSPIGGPRLLTIARIRDRSEADYRNDGNGVKTVEKVREPAAIGLLDSIRHRYEKLSD